MRPPWRARFSLLAAAMLLFAATTSAGDWQLRLLDGDGEPIAHAVITAEPIGGAAPEHSEFTAARGAVTQFKQSFSPPVVPVRVGATVEFPNRDRMRHHVYSFSEAKTFELRLYGDAEVPRIVFDRAGIVTLGCNIHDWMQGYIYVTDAPVFTATDDDGVARLPAIDRQRYQFAVWHPSLSETTAISLNADLNGDVVVATLARPVAPVRQARPNDDPLSVMFQQRMEQ